MTQLNKPSNQEAIELTCEENLGLILFLAGSLAPVKWERFVQVVPHWFGPQGPVREVRISDDGKVILEIPEEINSHVETTCC